MAQPAEPPRRSRRSGGAVTLHDVAKLAGVAPITDARALNHPSRVLAEVLKKVGDAVARTGDVHKLLPSAIVASLNGAAVKPKLLKLGVEIVGNTPEQFTVSV